MRYASVALLAGLASGSISSGALAQTRDPTVTVTSDSPEYCSVLINRISGLTRTTAMPPPTDAAALSEEGQRMCGNGQFRGGILRLRRALILMHGTETYNTLTR